MDKQQSEQKQFLDELGIKSDASMTPEFFTGPEEPRTEELEPEKEEEAEESAKNRRERRLMAKLQAERESNIAMNARIQALAEAQKVKGETEEADFEKLIEPIFGSVDEKGQYDPRRVEATNLLKKALRGAYESAKREAAEEAYSRFAEERQGESQAEAQASDEIDDGMDAVEEKYGLNFGSKKTHDRYLELLEDVSPKDEDGDIREYAFDAAARLLEVELNKSNPRAKELAARSTVRSGSSEGAEGQDQSFYNSLKELGLMD